MTRRNKQQANDVQDVNAFMHEVEEAMHMEQLQTFWHTYKVHLITALVIAFGGFSAFKFYKTQQESSLTDAANAYYATTKHGDGSATLEELLGSDAEGISLLARIHLAKQLAEEGKTSEAMVALDEIILNENLATAYRHLAKIYKAELALSSDVTLAQSMLDEMVTSGSVYLPSVMELLGYTYEKQGNTERAAELYTQIINMGGKAPRGVAVRAQQRLNSLTK